MKERYLGLLRVGEFGLYQDQNDLSFTRNERSSQGWRVILPDQVSNRCFKRLLWGA